jgi:hypothetical protein
LLIVGKRSNSGGFSDEELCADRLGTPQTTMARQINVQAPRTTSFRMRGS